VERDRAADAALTAAGWRVVRIWEHIAVTDAVAAVAAALAGGNRGPA
jgi:DNA mismatch endonuclease, patch repair protein